MNYLPPKQTSIQGFWYSSGEKYGLSGNEIGQVKPHRAKAAAS
jgi:hypothetical protein